MNACCAVRMHDQTSIYNQPSCHVFSGKFWKQMGQLANKFDTKGKASSEGRDVVVLSFIGVGRANYETCHAHHAYMRAVRPRTGPCTGQPHHRIR